MKIVATVEARMGSSRFPGKVLMPVNGVPIIKYLFERLENVPSIDEIILATTINNNDEPLVEFAKNEDIHFFRGSEENVMKRVIDAASYLDADIIVEITGDCPLIDPQIVEQAIQIFLANNIDYVSNGNVRSYPDGMDTQVFRLETLKQSFNMTTSLLDYEHVTLHIRNNPEIFSHINIIAPPEIYWPDLGLTLDEKEDFELIKKIINYFGTSNKFFSCLDVVSLLKKKPNWIKINKNIKRKGDS